MGCIGMSYECFCRCTPSEFHAIWQAWSEMREADERGAWERMRMQCLCSLQPYSQKRLKATDVMELPWDEKPKAAEPVSDEELMRRYEAARKRMGLE